MSAPRRAISPANCMPCRPPIQDWPAISSKATGFPRGFWRHGSRPVLDACKLAPDARRQQSLFSISQQAGRPIRESAVGDRVAVAVRRRRRYPQAQTPIVAQPLQTCQIETELSIRKLDPELFEELGFQARQPKMRNAAR